uniref:Uncharacterized protein n=1 Tax=Glossina pallidipes TaxID=7398 RepID=A0A1A9ZX45_GLOPL
MSTAKRLVLSLRGRKNSESNTATSSTRLVSAGVSPGHELDEIAIVSGTGDSSHHFTYGGIGSDINNGPRYSTAPQIMLSTSTAFASSHVIDWQEIVNSRSSSSLKAAECESFLKNCIELIVFNIIYS